MRLQQTSEVVPAKIRIAQGRDGPATEKVRGPSVLSRHRRTTKRRWVADRRCCRAETSDTGVEGLSGTAVLGRAVCTVHYDAEFILNSFRHEHYSSARAGKNSVLW